MQQHDALTATGLTKRFGPRTVVRGVDLTVRAGEVHALVGPNGSGKSTVVKILSGFHEPTSVERLEIGGRQVDTLSSARVAADLGVRVVHQDLGLVPELSILENVALAAGYETRGPLLSWAASRRRCAVVLEQVGLHRSPDTLVRDLAVWERVAVAFARAIYDGLDKVSLLILDEITAALPRDQVVNVLEVVRTVKQLGAGVLYVSHRFEEIFEIADWVTVLVDGSVVASAPIAEFTAPDLVQLVAGKAVEAAAPHGEVPLGDALIDVDSLENDRLHEVSMQVRGGEIVAIIGRAGCGRSALGRVLFGLEKASGTIRLNGRTFGRPSVRSRMRAGIGYVPQDRFGSGILPAGSVKENATLIDLGSVSRAGMLSNRAEIEQAERLVKEYDVRPADIDALMTQLSGGNQQKVLVARWMSRPPKVLVLDEPTEGVDAGARATIYRLIDRLRRDGSAVLVLTSSIEEAMQLGDRVILMSDGRVIDEFSGSRLNEHELEQALLAGTTSTGTAS
ncbi:MAG TPA: sugar ABC transporter ATP-binding protein [Pseudolysinimonas sp.]